MTTRPRALTGAVLVALLTAVCLAAGVQAATPRTSATAKAIITDCAKDGKLKQRYPKKYLTEARKRLPTDVAQYTGCSAVLRRALKGTLTQARSDCRDGRLTAYYSRTIVRKVKATSSSRTKAGRACRKVMAKELKRL